MGDFARAYPAAEGGEIGPAGIAASADGTVVLVDAYTDYYSNWHMLRSTDSGRTWADAAQMLYATHIVIDPVDPNRAYASGKTEDKAGVFRSTDGGATWTYVPEAVDSKDK